MKLNLNTPALALFAGRFCSTGDRCDECFASIRGVGVARRSTPTRMERSISMRRRPRQAPCSTSLRRTTTARSTARNCRDRIPDADWTIADPDNDKTISKDEYLAYVEAVFKHADTDNDGTLDAKELRTPAGHALLRLLMK